MAALVGDFSPLPLPLAELMIENGVSDDVLEAHFENVVASGGGKDGGVGGGAVRLARVQAVRSGKDDGQRRRVPTDGAVCKVTYKGVLAANGSEFHRSLEGYTFSFTLGKGEVIAGWDVGIKAMAEGETALLYIHSSFGYGSADSEDIPAHSNLLFLVTLSSFDDAPEDALTPEAKRLAEIRLAREEAKKKRETDNARRAEAKRLAAERLASKGVKKGKGKKKKKQDWKPKEKKKKGKKKESNV